MADDNLLLSGLEGDKMGEQKIDEQKEKTSSSTETKTDDNKDKPEVTDLGVVESSGEAEDEAMEEYKNKLMLAHDSLDGKNISDIPLNHPYWHLMNSARQFKDQKGIK